MNELDLHNLNERQQVQYHIIYINQEQTILNIIYGQIHM